MLRLALLGVICISTSFAAQETPAERAARWRAALVSPCCWTESLETHGSARAVEARALLDRLLAENRTDDEIRGEFLVVYGAAVFAVPPGEKADWLFSTPLAATIAGLLFASWALWRMRSTGTRQPADGPQAVVDDSDLGW